MEPRTLDFIEEIQSLMKQSQKYTTLNYCVLDF